MTKGEGMARTAFAQHGLVRLGYEVQGDGQPAVLVLHGLLQDRVTMRPLVDALTEQTTVIAMDLRGHGGSSAVHGLDVRIDDLARDVFAVLDAAEVGSPVIIVGVELGAVIAATMATTHPDRVAATLPISFPTAAMTDAATLTAIADLAYRGQLDTAIGRWLDLAWGGGWQERVPKARIAAARRNAAALHPMLTALAGADVAQQESLTLPGGTPFVEKSDVEQVISRLASLLPRA